MLLTKMLLASFVPGMFSFLLLHPAIDLSNGT
jgi:hypothetical protein